MPKIKKIIFITDIILIILITIAVLTGKTYNIDEQIFKTLHSLTSGKYINFFKIFTQLGSTQGIFITTMILLVLLFKRGGINITINIILTGLLNLILKMTIQRPRPTWKLIEQAGYSYPSGHSMAVFCIYGYLIFLASKSITKKRHKYISYILSSTMILLIGISRIYLGVHYASDVIGGYLITFAFLLYITNKDIYKLNLPNYLKKSYNKQQTKKQGNIK